MTARFRPAAWQRLEDVRASLQTGAGISETKRARMRLEYDRIARDYAGRPHREIIRALCQCGPLVGHVRAARHLALFDLAMLAGEDQ